MSPLQVRLFSVIENIVPLRSRPEGIPHSTPLTQLGFDSLALVSLFVGLEEEFDLSAERMHRHLRRSCTVGSLLQLCGSEA